MPDGEDDRNTDGLINSTSDTTVSGAHIRAYRAGQLTSLTSLTRRRNKLLADLAKVEERLFACNHDVCLDRLATWCKNKNLDFAAELERQAQELEAAKEILKENLRAIDEALARFKHPILLTTLAIPSIESDDVLIPTKKRPPRDDLEKRNSVINQQPERPHLEICKSLDYAFGDEKAPPPSLPRSWFEEFGVKTFVAAYRDPKCRPRVESLISKAKKKGSYLKLHSRRHRSR